MSKEAKIHFLFKKIHYVGLKNIVEALKAQLTTGVYVTYTMAANHISTAVSELPEYISKNRNLSAVGKYKLEGRSEKPTIYNSKNQSRPVIYRGGALLARLTKRKSKPNVHVKEQLGKPVRVTKTTLQPPIA